MGAGGGVRRAPSRLPRAPRTCGCRGAGAAALSAEQPPPLALARARSHFYAAACDRLFRFCRLRQFAPTFRLKLPFSASFSSFARWDRPSPAFSFFFFFSPSSATTRTLIDAHPQNPAHRPHELGPGAPRMSGAVALGTSGGSERLQAGSEELASSGERLTAGSGARERLNAEFCLGTTCQEKRRLTNARRSNL